MSLFQGKRIFVNDDFKPAIKSRVESLILSNGGVVVKDRSKSSSANPDLPRFDPMTTTHVVAAGSDFPEYERCWEPDGTKSLAEKGPRRPFVVSTQWISRSLKQRMIESELGHSAKPEAIFSGVVACTTNVSTEVNLQIRAMIEAYGGRTVPHLTRETTHLLTDSRKGTKYKTAMLNWEQLRENPNANLNAVDHKIGIEDEKIPELALGGPMILLLSWVEHSYKSLMCLDPLPYRFDLDDKTQFPQVTKLSMEEPEDAGIESRLNRDHTNRNGASINERLDKHVKSGESVERLPYNSKTAFPITNNGLQGKYVLFSSQIREKSRKETLDAFTTQIEKCGAKIVPPITDYNDEIGLKQSIRNADIVICMFRDDEECVQAYRDGSKIIGTVEWLVHIMKLGRLSSPFANVLHFPRPSGPCPPFTKLRIAISNYEGAARVHLKKMIERLGAGFTPDLTKINTHIISPALKGDKVESGRAWGLTVVNHHWLEACFCAWERVPENGNEKFTQFNLPAATVNSSVGNISLDEEIVARWFSEYEVQRRNGELDANGHDVEMQDGDQTVEDEARPDESVMVDELKNFGDTSKNLDTITPVLKKKSGKRSSESIVKDTVLQDGDGPGPSTSSPTKKKKPRTEKVEEEKEEVSMSVDASTSKVSKSKGSSRKTSKGKEPEPDVEEEEEPEIQAKEEPQVEEDEEEEDEEEEDEEEEVEEERPIFFVTTGYSLKAAHQTQLNKMGITFQDQFDEKTNLVVSSKVSRTEKLLRGLAKGDVNFVSGSWVESSVKAKMPVDFGDHPIVDRETEKKINESAKDKSLKFNWSKSIARSRRLPSRFLEGRTFFFSPSFEADSAAEIMRSVVIEAGGKCPKKINWKVIFSSIGDNNVHLIGVEQDRTLWQQEMQKHKIGKDDEFKVYKKELISMGVLRMKMDWESDLL